jgi:hypothetical protein
MAELFTFAACAEMLWRDNPWNGVLSGSLSLDKR